MSEGSRSTGGAARGRHDGQSGRPSACSPGQSPCLWEAKGLPLSQVNRMAAILVTATISPRPGVPNLAVTDPAQRLEEYVAAFGAHLEVLCSGTSVLVFVENSGADLSLFSDMAREKGLQHRVEFIHTPPPDYPAEYGRGYAEFRLIDYALARSRFLTTLPDNALIWKVTGRYPLRNLVRLMATAPAHAEIYCNLRRFPMRFMDMYAFAATRCGFRALLGATLLLREDRYGIAPEIMLFGVLRALSLRPDVVVRFTLEPAIAGRRGKDGRRNDDWRQTAKRRVRAGARRLLPAVWI